MNPIEIMFNFLVLSVFVSALISTIKRKRFNASPRPKPSFPKMEKKAMNQDLFQAYSSKNKECFEHQVKASGLDDKPKRRKSLWNEPSWDDELYLKK